MFVDLFSSYLLSCPTIFVVVIFFFFFFLLYSYLLSQRKFICTILCKLMSGFFSRSILKYVCINRILVIQIIQFYLDNIYCQRDNKSLCQHTDVYFLVSYSIEGIKRNQ